MLDGAELARTLVEEPAVDAAVTRYEERMIQRSAPLAEGANGALARFFADGERDASQTPDPEREHRRYQAAAAEYRRDRPLTTAGTAVHGTWRISYRTPRGDQQATLILDPAGSEIAGSLDGRPLCEAQVDGPVVRFTATLTSPFRMKVAFTVSVDGDTMIGQAKAPMMTVPVDGVRASA
jgi:hypothetical protein